MAGFDYPAPQPLPAPASALPIPPSTARTEEAPVPAPFALTSPTLPVALASTPIEPPQPAEVQEQAIEAVYRPFYANEYREDEIVEAKWHEDRRWYYVRVLRYLPPERYRVAWIGFAKVTIVSRRSMRQVADSEIRHLPQRVHEQELRARAERPPPAYAYSGADGPDCGEATSCAICLEEFGAAGEQQQLLQKYLCAHVFHEDCIAGWVRAFFEENRDAYPLVPCPVCRALQFVAE